MVSSDFWLKTLSTFKSVRIIDHNELNKFLFRKERKTKNRNEKKAKRFKQQFFQRLTVKSLIQRSLCKLVFLGVC